MEKSKKRRKKEKKTNKKPEDKSKGERMSLMKKLINREQ